VNPQPGFDNLFRALTSLPSGETPFPWQQALFGEFMGKSFRTSCNRAKCYVVLGAGALSAFFGARSH